MTPKKDYKYICGSDTFSASLESLVNIKLFLDDEE